jgi:hypothetical protein
MDPSRFDALARLVASRAPRRAALRALAAGALGARLGLGAGDGAGATHAGCRHDGKDCARAGQCCSGRCAANGTCQPCTKAGQCPRPANPCKRAVCTTGGRCEVRDKPAEAACPDDGDPCTDDVCDGNGACTHPPLDDGTTCGEGKACCGGGCTALGTEADCARCGDACAADQSCVAGSCTCTAGSCPDGCCDGDQCKPGTSAQVCGRNGGTCAACAGNDACCGGACAALGTEANCGACGNACNPARTCEAGACVCPGTCPKNFVQQPNCTCVCPAGFEEVNGGCFRTCNDDSGVICARYGDCGCAGSMVGSGNYLCIDYSSGSNPGCTSNAVCPSGASCNAGGGSCRFPC